MKVLFSIAFLFAVVLLSGPFFVVQEGQQALITQFGKIVGSPKTMAGLYWKMPFIQDVRLFDRRILSWDGDPNQIPTKDKKYILVDTTARFRIVDPVKYAETVTDEAGARARLDGILDGSTRDVISRHNLVEGVRNTNAILDRINQKRSENVVAAAAAAGDSVAQAALQAEVEEEISGEIEPISVGRERLSESILERVRPELESLGIELIDVQLRRIAYEASVEQKVFSRMISERQRIAEKIRSIGKGEEAKIRGKLNRDLKEIESVAYRKSEEIRGRAEAESITIYAQSLNKNPEYYRFQRTLEAYRQAIPGRAELVLSTDSDFFKLLKTQK